MKQAFSKRPFLHMIRLVRNCVSKHNYIMYIIAARVSTYHIYLPYGPARPLNHLKPKPNVSCHIYFWLRFGIPAQPSLTMRFIPL